VASFCFGTLHANVLKQPWEVVVECHSLVFRRVPGKALFSSDAERIDFLERAAALGQRWKISVWGFRLFQGSAHFVVEGAEVQVRHFQRLLQSGHGVWRYHQGDVLIWTPAEQWCVGEAGEGHHEMDRLHAVGVSDPLRAGWSSLRDYLGLRDAPWFEPPQELEAFRSQAQWRVLHGLPESEGSSQRRNPLNPTPGCWVDEAIVQSTGRVIHCRKNAKLRSASLWHAGWEIWEISIQLSIGSPATRKAIRNCDPTLLRGVLTLLQDERLFASLQSVDWP
jgi:hypothetical protein